MLNIEYNIVIYLYSTSDMHVYIYYVYKKVNQTVEARLFYATM